MKNRGFTLIELLGVIIIIALLMLLVFPNVIDSVKNNSDKVNGLTNNLIYNAANLYLKDNQDNYVKDSSRVYCIPIETLIEDGYIDRDSIIAVDRKLLHFSIETVYNNDKNIFEYIIKENCEDI